MPNNLKITNDWVYIHLTSRQAKQLGAVWNRKENKYRLPNTLGVLRELYRLVPAEKQSVIAKHGMKKAYNQVKLLDLKKLNDIEGDKRLRSYQRVDVNYLMNIGSAGIFNEQRTGKTPTTLVLCEEKGFEKIVIVCPASLVLNWQQEVEQWTKYEMTAIQGTQPQRNAQYKDAVNGIIVSYETLRNDLAEIQLHLDKFDCLIVDEAHRLRSLINGRRASQVSKAVVALGKYAKTRYALTGTPVVKEGQEVWGILHFLYPNKFPGYWQFLDRYFEVGFNGFGNEVVGYKRKEEIQDILAIISTNRKRKEVMQWLPDKQYQTIKLEMNNKQKKAYTDVLETFVYEDLIDAPSVLAQLTRLRQLTTCPAILVPDIPSEKEKYILEWLEDNPDENVVIFSTFSTYLNELHANMHKKRISSMLITGKQTKEQRNLAVKSFQEGKTKVILANIKAAGTGLTLDKGETIIFLDKEYNSSENEQAEDRIVPTSRDKNHNMHIITLVMQDTIDEWIEILLQRKINVTKVINNAGKDVIERIEKLAKSNT